jgi:hypothetical protein
MDTAPFNKRDYTEPSSLDLSLDYQFAGVRDQWRDDQRDSAATALRQQHGHSINDSIVYGSELQQTQRINAAAAFSKQDVHAAGQVYSTTSGNLFGVSFNALLFGIT